MNYAHSFSGFERMRDARFISKKDSFSSWHKLQSTSKRCIRRMPKELLTYGCVQVHFDMWEVKSGEVVSFAQEMGSRLQVLKLNTIIYSFTVEAAEAIAEHCTSLQELSISGQKYGRSSRIRYADEVNDLIRTLCNIASLKVLAVSTAAMSMFDFSDPTNLKSKSDGFIVPEGLKVVNTI